VANPRWWELGENFKICADDTNQSPIDLRPKDMMPGRRATRPSLRTAPATFQVKRAKSGSALPLLTLDQYFAPVPRMVGDGEPVNPPGAPNRAGVLNLPGFGKYELAGFHFHSGSSEHTVEGRPGVAEIHFVFNRVEPADEPGVSSKMDSAAAAARSRLSMFRNAAAPTPSSVTDETAPEKAVVSVMFKATTGQGNPFLSTLIRTVLPRDGKTPVEASGSLVDLDIGELLPPLEESDFATYLGSLTTPPCTENVRWIVYQRQLEADASQVAAMMSSQGGGDNVRQIQPFEGLVEKYSPLPFAEGWDYEGPKKANPRWAKLTDNFKLCADTTNQSPIDLRYKKMLAGSEPLRPHLDTNVSVFQAKRSKNGSDLPLISFEQYLVRPPRVVGDAPPVVSWSPPSRGALLTLPGAGQYGLIGFHFHGGSSEHTVNGKSGVAEVHFVFKRIGGPNGISKEAVKAVDEKRGGGESRNVSTATRAAKSRLSAIGRNLLAEVDGTDQRVVAPPAAVTPEAAPAPAEPEVVEDEDAPPIPDIAVVGVLFKETTGAGDPFLSTLIKTVLPSSGDEYINPVGSLVDVDLSKVLAQLEDSEFATYMGSLTTPPCSENVRWIVYQRMLEANIGQVDRLIAAQGGTNVRATQPYGGSVERYMPVPSDRNPPTPVNARSKGN